MVLDVGTVFSYPMLPTVLEVADCVAQLCSAIAFCVVALRGIAGIASEWSELLVVASLEDNPYKFTRPDGGISFRF